MICCLIWKRINDDTVVEVLGRIFSNLLSNRLRGLSSSHCVKLVKAWARFAVKASQGHQWGMFALIHFEKSTVNTQRPVTSSVRKSATDLHVSRTGPALLQSWQKEKAFYQYIILNQSTYHFCTIYTVRAGIHLCWQVHMSPLGGHDMFVCSRWRQRTPASRCVRAKTVSAAVI